MTKIMQIINYDFQHKKTGKFVKAFEWTNEYDFLISNGEPFSDLFPFLFAPLNKRPKYTLLPFIRYIGEDAVSLKIGKPTVGDGGDRKKVLIGDWIVKDDKGCYDTYTEQEFKKNFEETK